MWIPKIFHVRLFVSTSVCLFVCLSTCITPAAVSLSSKHKISQNRPSSHLVSHFHLLAATLRSLWSVTSLVPSRRWGSCFLPWSLSLPSSLLCSSSLPPLFSSLSQLQTRPPFTTLLEGAIIGLQRHYEIQITMDDCAFFFFRIRCGKVQECVTLMVTGKTVYNSLHNFSFFRLQN